MSYVYLCSALVHDLAESLVGDITPYCGISKEDKKRKEMEAMQEIANLIEPRGKHLMELFLVRERQKTCVFIGTTRRHQCFVYDYIANRNQNTWDSIKTLCVYNTYQCMWCGYNTLSYQSRNYMTYYKYT